MKKAFANNINLIINSSKHINETLVIIPFKMKIREKNAVFTNK
jgi:hypothetical protein